MTEDIGIETVTVQMFQIKKVGAEVETESTKIGMRVDHFGMITGIKIIEAELKMNERITKIIIMTINIRLKTKRINIEEKMKWNQKKTTIVMINLISGIKILKTSIERKKEAK